MLNINELPDKPYYPDYYMELQGHDVRLCVKKIHEFFDTIFLARYSLIYCDENEYIDEDEIKKQLFIRIHLNNAILWFNNSFDILLQSIWFMYRVWTYYNFGGSLRTNYLKNKKDINRNTHDWVKNAELNCSYDKITNYLKTSSDIHFVNILTALENFSTRYRDIRQNICIRRMANQIKHMTSLKISEFEEITKFTFNVNENTIKMHDIRDKYSLEINQQFYDQDDESITGKININYNQDFYVNISYDNGDFFDGKDLLSMNISYSYQAVVDELVQYNNGILDLYCAIYKELEDKISKLPSVGDYKIKSNNNIFLENK